MKNEINIRKILSFSYLGLLMIFISGCSWLVFARFQQFNDEFRNSTKTITRMQLRPLERRTEVGSAYIIFEREQSVESDIVSTYCVITRSSASFAADRQAFIKIDNDSYELTLQNLVSEQKMQTETSTSSFTESDSTGVSSGSTSDSDTRIWIVDKFIFRPTDEMVNKIVRSDNLILRFYFGPIPATYRIYGEDLKLLKKTLADEGTLYSRDTDASIDR